MKELPGFIADLDGRGGTARNTSLASPRERERGMDAGLSPQMMRVFRFGGHTAICYYDDQSGDLGYCDLYD